MTTLTEVVGRRNAEALVSELPGMMSRDDAVVASGAGVVYGNTILGKITASGKYVPHNTAAADGSQNAAAILLHKVDATSADAKAVIVYKDAVFNANEVIFMTGISAPNKTAAIAALKALGIVLR
jgi:hypothetical protein